MVIELHFAELTESCVILDRSLYLTEPVPFSVKWGGQAVTVVFKLLLEQSPFFPSNQSRGDLQMCNSQKQDQGPREPALKSGSLGSTSSLSASVAHLSNGLTRVESFPGIRSICGAQSRAGHIVKAQ